MAHIDINWIFRHLNWIFRHLLQYGAVGFLIWTTAFITRKHLEEHHQVEPHGVRKLGLYTYLAGSAILAASLLAGLYYAEDEGTSRHFLDVTVTLACPMLASICWATRGYFNEATKRREQRDARLAEMIHSKMRSEDTQRDPGPATH